MIDGLKTTTTAATGAIIVGALVDINGNLIITLSNGQTINAGAVKGASGERGFQGERGEQGNKGDAGDQGPQGIPGVNGQQGEKGNSGQSFEIDRYALSSEKPNFDHEPEGFSLLVVDAAGGPQLCIKKSNGVGDWFDGVAFAKPLQGPQGDQGPQGIPGVAGEQGATGAGLYPDYRGTLSERSAYDADQTGTIFYDIDNNQFYVKLSEIHGHWSAARDMMRGEQGVKGEKGDGLKIDTVITSIFNGDNYTDGSVYPIGSTIFSTASGQLYTRVTNAISDSWSEGVDIRGPKGEKGDNLHVDTAISNIIELDSYERMPVGFMALNADTQNLYVKKVEWPYPGQDTSLNYTLPEYNTPEYLQSKSIWDNSSHSERIDILWSSFRITQGPQGEVGPQGEQGEQGDIGIRGEQGAGFQPDHTGAGLRERALYDHTAAGTSYLDTTYGMLYFRQTATSGEWGPAIAIAASGGNVAGAEFISHGEIADGTDTVPTHNMLRISTAATGSAEAQVNDMYLSGTAYQNLTHEQLAANSGTHEVYVMTISYGQVLRPEVWITQAFDDTSLEGKFFLYFEANGTNVGNITIAATDGNTSAFIDMNRVGMYELDPVIIDNTIQGIDPTHTEIKVRAKYAITAGAADYGATTGALKYVINRS